MDRLQQAQIDGVVVGLKDVAGVVPRLEIDDLILNEPDTFNLFALALIDLQNEKSEDIMSFYEITGIHGLPRKLWDEVDSSNKDPNTVWQGEGYCAHGTQTFPTWHRPYIAMMEQSIYSKMADKIKEYPAPVRPKYQAALQKFRLPYWDYYRPRGPGKPFPGVPRGDGTTQFRYDFSLPEIFTNEQIMLRRSSDDKLVLTENPLNRFFFPSTGSLSAKDWQLADSELKGTGRTFIETRTCRYPDSDTDAAVDNVSKMNDTLNKERESRNINILNMIQSRVYADYGIFSTDIEQEDVADRLQPSGSLERIHGNYHNLVGGLGGHMSHVPVAAFDPVFWLHHCQIDRWFSIWQGVNTDSWFADADLAESELLPFRKSRRGSASAFWTSDDSRTTEVFGYYYQDARGTSQQVKDNFKRRYEWGVRTAAHRRYTAPPSEMLPLPIQNAQIYQYNAEASGGTVAAFANNAPQVVLNALSSAGNAVSSAVTNGSSATHDSDVVASAPVSAPASTQAGPVTVPEAPQGVDETKYGRDWYIDTKVERLALNGSFSMYFFIGDFNKNNPEEYVAEPSMAALDYVFAAPTQACDNCGVQAQQGRLVTGTSPITPILLDYIEVGQLQDLTPASVAPFLVKNLKWRVVKPDGRQVDPREVPGFKVGLTSKLTALSPAAGPSLYEDHQEIVDEIIANAS